MRLVIVIAALVSVVACSPKAEKEQYSGQVVFFYLPQHTEQEARETSEVEADLEHVLEVVTPYLDKNRIKYDIKREVPFSLSTFDGKQISLGKKDLPSTAGYILVKKDGNFVIREGLGTDVDVIADVMNYFQIGTGEEASTHNIWLQPTRKSGAAFLVSRSFGRAAFAVG